MRLVQLLTITQLERQVLLRTSARNKRLICEVQSRIQGSAQLARF